MVPFAPLEDAEEPEPCHKMELYVSGGEVSVGPGPGGGGGGGEAGLPPHRGRLPPPPPRGHLPPRPPPPPGSGRAGGGQTATPPAPASPRRLLLFLLLPGFAGLPPFPLLASLPPVCPPPSPASLGIPPPPAAPVPLSVSPAARPGTWPAHASSPGAPPPGPAFPRSWPRPVPGRWRWSPGATPLPVPAGGPGPRRRPLAPVRASLGGGRHCRARRRAQGWEGDGERRCPAGCGLRGGRNTCGVRGEPS